jgi:hypothetical protein
MTFVGENVLATHCLQRKKKRNLLKPFQKEILALQYCCDGADAFNLSGKSFWPGCVSILNLPKDL